MKKIISVMLLLISLSFSSFVQGAGFDVKPPGGVGVGNTPNIDIKSASAEKLVENIIVNVVNILFTIGGLGVVIYFVWGAVDWIFSGGDKEKVANARKKMTHALIGLALLSLSFVLINILGEVIGFNPLGNLQFPDLGTGVPGTTLPKKL